MRNKQQANQYQDLRIGSIRIPVSSMASSPREYEFLRILAGRLGLEVQKDSRLAKTQEDIFVRAYCLFRTAKVYTPRMDMALASTVLNRAVSFVLREIREPNRSSDVKQYSDGGKSCSLDAPVDGTDGTVSWVDVIPDTYEDPASKVASEMDFREALNQLDKRSRKLIEMLESGMTYAEAGVVLKISASYARRLAIAAWEKVSAYLQE